MWRAGFHRRLMALAAAYAVALQGMLAAVAPAPTLDTAVCTAESSAHGGNAGGHAPVPRADCTLCPLACGSAVTPPPPPARLALHVAAGDTMPAPRPDMPVKRVVQRAGLARAPPR
jgi:hypothetical protein